MVPFGSPVHVANGPEIVVLVPTLANQARAKRLLRAVDSILTQAGVRPIPCVVVNGPDADPDVVQGLRADTRLRVVRVQEPGLANALRVGRQHVDSPFFSALDDDDVLLPGALRSRADALEKDSELDAVVSNGLVRHHGVERLHIADIDTVRADPQRAMLQGNWLLPGSWLCRTTSVGPELFAAMPECLECTWLGLWLVTQRRLGFLADPSVVWNSDSADGLHFSRAFQDGRAEALKRILTLPLTPDVHRAFRARIAESTHECANREYWNGSRWGAWRWHIRSLRASGGLRYLPFTLRLLGLRRKRR